VKNSVTENKVEYNFDFTEKYEKQSDQNLINVKGNLRKKSLQHVLAGYSKNIFRWFGRYWFHC
jgi:hypothetical protein